MYAPNVWHRPFPAQSMQLSFLFSHFAGGIRMRIICLNMPQNKQLKIDQALFEECVQRLFLPWPELVEAWLGPLSKM